MPPKDLWDSPIMIFRVPFLTSLFGGLCMHKPPNNDVKNGTLKIIIGLSHKSFGGIRPPKNIFSAADFAHFASQNE